MYIYIYIHFPFSIVLTIVFRACPRQRPAYAATKLPHQDANSASAQAHPSIMHPRAKMPIQHLLKLTTATKLQLNDLPTTMPETVLLLTPILPKLA